jgi:hypothetical protein
MTDNCREAMTTEWEYHIERNTGSRVSFYSHDWLDRLNELGAAGWELVSEVREYKAAPGGPVAYANELTLASVLVAATFKRPKP